MHTVASAYPRANEYNSYNVVSGAVVLTIRIRVSASLLLASITSWPLQSELWGALADGVQVDSAVNGSTSIVLISSTRTNGTLAARACGEHACAAADAAADARSSPTGRSSLALLLAYVLARKWIALMRIWLAGSFTKPIAPTPGCCCMRRTTAVPLTCVRARRRRWQSQRADTGQRARNRPSRCAQGCPAAVHRRPFLGTSIRVAQIPS